MIYGPDGVPMVPGLPENERGIVTANLDLDQIGFGKALYDAVGHYTRGDIFTFRVDRSSRRTPFDAGIPVPSPQSDLVPSSHPETNEA
jgi:hypothetical protein